MKFFVIACCLSCVAAGALAAESTRIYRHVGPDGVVTFSDEPTEGAEVVEIVVDRPREEDVARTQAMHAQQVEMGASLEESRHADEATRAQARELELERARLEAARAAAEATAEQDHDDEYIWAPWYGPGYPSWPPDDGRPGPPPPHPPRPPKPAPSPIPPKPLMGEKPH
jgi:hypothetical protein